MKDRSRVKAFFFYTGIKNEKSTCRMKFFFFFFCGLDENDREREWEGERKTLREINDVITTHSTSIQIIN
jgi:hypothetical protein